jgi:hypothetical protein
VNEERRIGQIRSSFFFLGATSQMEDAMMLYVFWASLWLGLMRLSAEVGMPQQRTSHSKPSKPGSRAPDSATDGD